MRILVLIPTLGYGGAERMLTYLLPALQDRGHQCEVAVMWPPYVLAEELRQQGIKVHELNIGNEWGLLEGARKTARLCRASKIDILHARLLSATMHGGPTRFSLPRLARVASFHSVDYEVYPAVTPVAKIRKRLHGFFLRRFFDGYVGISNAVARHYEEELGLPAVEVIPNCFPVEEFKRDPNLDRRAILEQFGASPDDFVAVMAARLVGEKGHIYAIQAVELLRERGLRPKLLICGDGPLEETLKQEVQRRKLADQILFCGTVPHAELLKLIQVADILAFPSIQEGFGNAAAEAMLYECPVLATNIGAFRDVMVHEESGLLMEPASAESLADGFQRLMQDTNLRKRLGAGGHKRIADNFSAEKIAAQYESYYQKILEQKSK